MPPLTPSPPIAKRLNRNALVIAAIGMFLLVLVTLVTTQRTRTPVDEPEAVETTTTPHSASFLDFPLDPAQDTEPPLVSADALPHDVTSDDVPSAWNDGVASYEEAMRDIPVPSGMEGLPSELTREAVYHRALRSPVIPQASSIATGTASTDAPLDDPVSATDADAQDLTPPIDPLAAPPHTLGTQALSGDASATDSSAVLLDAGTMIPATLVTAVNSDVPGLITAVVSHTVYDSRTQRRVVIPQGTKLIGDYSTEITGSQQRLVMRWTRMIFPNGDRLALPNWSASDDGGAAGVPGDVQRHTGRVIRSALLLSMIGAGLQLSQPQQSTVYTPPSPGQIAAGAMGQQFGDVATTMLRKQLDIPPTITMPAGTTFLVVVQADLALSPR